LTTGITLLVFIFTTLIKEPASIATLVVILLVSIGLDLVVARRPRNDPDPGGIPA
jgi:predicted tellurium resistance membrane protein TerC